MRHQGVDNIPRRHKLTRALNLQSDDDYWESFTKGGKVLSRPALRTALKFQLYIRPSVELIGYLMSGKEVLKRHEFDELIRRLNRFRHTNTIPKSE